MSAQAEPDAGARGPAPSAGRFETVNTENPAPITDEDAILGMLRGVMDPELHDNIVDLGMVRGGYLEDEDLQDVMELAAW